MATMEQAREALRGAFGYESFRPGQEGLIEAILAGRDVLGVMPTGAGKSLCYQVPALVMEGLTIVVSPLVSLMGDQVSALKEAGVAGSYLNSTLTPGQQATVLRRARDGWYKIMYVAPERLSDFRFLEFVQATSIPLVAIDEAHCVSQWGQDFRPSYLMIGEFVERLPRRPVVAAFTATATERVRADIVRLLGLRDPRTEVTGFDRPNLYFSVERLAPKPRADRIVSYALGHAGESGIVYCATRKETERMHAMLVEAGVPATRYHAGLSHAERTANQRAFVADDAPVMVATNAFGMGIDKSNVRYVVHHNMPGSLEAYYQEAGRAGRDGEPAECLLLWSDGDVSTQRSFIERDAENEGLTAEETAIVRASKRRQLAAICGYCRTTGCLRDYILNYFGDEPARHREGRVGYEVVSLGEEDGTDQAALIGTAATGGAVGLDARACDPLSCPSGFGVSCEPASKQVYAAVSAGGRAEGGSNAAGSTNVPKGTASGCARGQGLPGVVGRGPKEESARRDYALDGLDERARRAAAAHDETEGAAVRCCSNCDGDFEAVDVTDVARAVMRCVKELRGRFGKTTVADVLCGTESARVVELHLDQARTFGAVSVSSSQVKEVIELMAAEGYLEITEGKYPLVGLGPRAREAAREDFTLRMKRAPRKALHERGAAKGAATPPQAVAAASFGAESTDEALFNRLRALRKRIADDAGMPPYIVFSDATLRDMCVRRPSTEDEFLQVSGVGATKLARYGKDFLGEIAAFEHREDTR